MVAVCPWRYVIEMSPLARAMEIVFICAWFVAAATGIWLHVWGGAYAELSAPATAVIAFVIYAAGLTQARRSWFLAAG